MDRNLRDLRTLAFFHYTLAGLNVVPVAIMLIQYLANVQHSRVNVAAEPGGASPYSWIASFIVLMFVGVAFFNLAYSVALFLAGRFLGLRRHYLYCQVIAGVSCMLLPCGTILGIFTFVVLARPAIRARFAEPQ
jgi:hypothetical protein